MSGQKSTTSDSGAGRRLHHDRGTRDAATDVHRTSQSDSRPSILDSFAGTDRGRTIGSAQHHWPEYNRVIIFASAGTAAAIIATAIVRAVAG